MPLPRRLARAVPLLAVWLLIPGFAVHDSASPGLPILTFNIRYDNAGDGPNAWPARKDIAASTILFHRAAVIGVQEALRGQLRDLEALLPGYGWFGLGRDDGKDGGEFNPVFYDQGRLRLLEGATFWLSEMPEVPGSRGWDGACNRIVTWGRFEEIASGRTFHVFNTHFDHVGRVARRESARLLLRKIEEIAGSGPAVVTGDFNCTFEDEPYRILTAGDEPAPPLRDARAVSLLPPYGGSRSFSGFRPFSGTGSIIDHVFIRGPVAVARTGVIADVWDGRFVSDHYPVLAEVVLGPAGLAAQPGPSERWYVVSLGGTPVGYFREAVSGSAASSWVTESAMVMVINRLGSRVDLGVSSRTEEGPDGRLRRTSSETKASALSMKSEASIGNGTIEVRSEAGGKSYSRTVAFKGELVGPEGMRRLSLVRLKKPGDVLEYQTYANELEKPAKGRRTLLGFERIEAGGRTIEAIKTEEVLEGAGEKATAWLDAEHEVVRQEMPTPFGQAVYVLSTREEALEAAGGASLSEEIFSRSVIRTSVRIPRARTTAALKVRLTRSEADGDWPDLAAHNQKVLGRTDRTLELEVRRPDPPRPVRLPMATAEADRNFLMANSIIQSDDPGLRAEVARILAGETDAWTAALKLARWVTEHMTFDAGIAMAPSAELFKNRHGTCLGYATLLATMARAAGLPSRVVLGYVYVLGVFGGHAWTEVKVGEAWLPLDAAVTGPGVADAARVAVGSSSLYEGAGSLTGGGASRILGRVGIRILGYNGVDGNSVEVPEDAKPYLIEGDAYINPWLGLRLAKPKGFAFGRLDAVWPDPTLVELIGPGGSRAGLQEGSFPPWAKPEEAAASGLRSFTNEGISRRETKDGRGVLISTAGEKAAAAILDGPLYWLLTASGGNAAAVLSELLAGFRFEGKPPTK